MVNATQLVLDFEKKGHPLGKSISEDELPTLIDELVQRLKSSTGLLDLSPTSLKILATLLLEYYQEKDRDGYFFSDEEIVQIIREIAAYFGKVLLSHSKGKWRVREGSWGAEIVLDGPVKTKKGSQTITHKRSIVPLFPVASGTWTALQKSIEPKLYLGYRLLFRKSAKEIF